MSRRLFFSLARNIARRLPAHWKYRVREEVVRAVPVACRSESDNVFHCCVYKTASQWIRIILSDWRVYRFSGLAPYNYESRMPDKHDPRPLGQRQFQTAFPRRAIVSPLYLDLSSYETIPKPNAHRTFFVVRDPRDVVVSWYFSVKYSHPLMGPVGQLRERLQQVGVEDGLCLAIEYLESFGLFSAIRSWSTAPKRCPQVAIYRFEDLTARENHTTFRELFAHCDIRVPEKHLARLLDNYSFEQLSGRSKGVENTQSKYRKGVAGDWANHFTPRVDREFSDVATDLLERFGYV